jgi:DNA polymerase-3 subunit delta
MKADPGKLRAALAAPAPDIRLYLLHGPDEAGAHAMVKRLEVAMGADAERVDLDAATLRSDPARLADEAASLSLFGGARFIRAAPIGEESLEAFAALLASDRAGNPVIAIAPAVRSTAKIVKLALDSPRAMACAFYEPTGAEAEKLAVTLARELGLQPEGGAARRIAEAAGNDRAIMARELEKFALYLDADPDRPCPLGDDTIDAVGADLSDSAMSELVAAVIDGQTSALGTALERLGQGGASPIPWLRALARRLIALADMRAEIDAGENPSTVMKRHRVFFREEAATLAALRRWSPAMLAEATLRVRRAERGTMAPANAGTVLADAAAIEIARAAASRR